MAIQTCMTAMMNCTMGMAPSSLMPTPKPVLTSNMVAANILDHVPMLNIMPFGMCTCPGNPTVAASTAAAFGVLTPMPCVPVTPAPWVPGAPTVLLAGAPALNNSSKLICIWGGTISFATPGQFTNMIP